MNSKRKYYLILFISLSIFKNISAQNKVLDSLKIVLTASKHDTTACKILIAMIELEGDDNVWPNYNSQLLATAEKNLKNNAVSSNTKLNFLFLKYKAEALNNKGYLENVKGNYEGALTLYNKALTIREQIGDKNGIGNSLSNIGVVYFNQGKTNKVLETYKKGLAVQQQIGDKNGMGTTLNNIGYLYLNQGDFSNALIYFRQNLKLHEEINNKDGMAIAYNNMAHIFESQDDLQKALEMNLKSLKLREETHNKQGTAESLMNIALYYFKKGDTLKAIQNNFKALALLNQIGNKLGIGYTLANLGTIYGHARNYDSAYKYINQSLIIREGLNDKKGLTDVYCGLSTLNLAQNKLKEAKFYGLKSLTIAKELGYPEDIFNASIVLYKIYKKQDQPKEALEMYELFILMHDSINNIESKKANIKSQLKYEYEKKAAADSVRVAEEKKVVTLQLKQEKTQRYALYGGLGLVGIFALFMVNRFRVTNKQKKLIEAQKKIVEEQKHLVDEKQKEILDSIRYAKRIQQSLLPTETYINRNLKNIKS